MIKKVKKKTNKGWKPVLPLTEEEVDAIGIKKYPYVEGMTLKDLYAQYSIKAKEFTAATGIQYMCLKNWWKEYSDDGTGSVKRNKAMTLIILFEGIAMSRRVRILERMKNL